MPILDVCGEPCEVTCISEGFARGVDGTCAFCKGDPCAESSEPETPIARYFEKYKWASTCPCCDGRPT